MHHNTKRMDTYAAFYFRPLDMAGITLRGSLSASLIVGLSDDTKPALLVAPAFVFDPAANMTAAWVVVSPVNHSTAIVRLVLAVERDYIADLQ